jgi:dolichyl-phosphate-mannose--protein O-mannosyl transferase
MSLYNRVIFRVAAKKSFLHISWLVALIGIPMVFFSDGLSLLGKGLLLTGLLVFFWLVYLALCIFFHRLSLRDDNNRAAYLAKNDIEKGEEVGSKLEGW